MRKPSGSTLAKQSPSVAAQSTASAIPSEHAKAVVVHAPPYSIDSNVPFDLNRAGRRNHLSSGAACFPACLERRGMSGTRSCTMAGSLPGASPDRAAAAEAIFAALLGRRVAKYFSTCRSPIATQLRSPWRTALLRPARMYSGPIRSVVLERVFGVTTFELG
jgi:hypothetical protein